MQCAVVLVGTATVDIGLCPRKRDSVWPVELEADAISWLPRNADILDSSDAHRYFAASFARDADDGHADSLYLYYSDD